MKTYSPKLAEMKREWFIVDAKDQILGRLCTKIANALRGKDKPTFSPHLDCGDHVIVINADKIKLTGLKLDQKKYYRHSGFPGALKEKTLKVMLEEKPEFVIENAVSGMLPKNRLRKHFLSKLKVYAGEEHPHAGQNPKPLKV